MNRNGEANTAASAKIRDIARGISTPLVSTRLLVTAKSEYEAPAQIASANPVALKCENPLAFAKTAIPQVVMSVALNHRHEGFSRVIRNATIPVSAGADPRAVTVPIATPVLLTAEKKVS